MQFFLNALAAGKTGESSDSQRCVNQSNVSLVFFIFDPVKFHSISLIFTDPDMKKMSPVVRNGCRYILKIVLQWWANFQLSDACLQMGLFLFPLLMDNKQTKPGCFGRPLPCRSCLCLFDNSLNKLIFFLIIILFLKKTESCFSLESRFDRQVSHSCQCTNQDDLVPMSTTFGIFWASLELLFEFCIDGISINICSVSQTMNIKLVHILIIMCGYFSQVQVRVIFFS